jgi:NitT/TauT family transport system substrate-binding protein
VNSKLAAEKPEVVKGFLNAFVRGLKDTIRSPAMAVDVVLKRDDLGKKEVELERLRMAIRDNIITPDVRAHGFGVIDRARLEESINQIGLTTAFKAKPKADDIFDPAFLPPAADRRVN